MQFGVRAGLSAKLVNGLSRTNVEPEPLSPCHLQRLPHFIHSGRPAGCEKLDSTVDWTTLSIASNEIKESKGNLDVGLWPPLQLGSLPSE